ncbi:DUF7344 domain-containing protein [Halobacterium zhouii]|uniref:DUF7344 domain-containing protein n=1 Tax=Halobacterium zhouii TaxID=2902624 RepID=UPI001E375335|nr:hypothetical protein [Halobacterium zhouii]
MSTSTLENYEELLATVDLSDTERYRLLSAKRRRIVCGVLADADGPVRFERLAEAVATREAAPDGREEADDVAVALHHVHLPRLAEVGVIEYDPETKQVGTDQTDLERLRDGRSVDRTE